MVYIHSKMVYKKKEENEKGTKHNIIMKNTLKIGVYTLKNRVSKKKKKRMKKGQNIENLSNFKLDCPNKLQMFSSTFTNCCFKG
jgi:hypothetical protein